MTQRDPEHLTDILAVCQIIMILHRYPDGILRQHLTASLYRPVTAKLLQGNAGRMRAITREMTDAGIISVKPGDKTTRDILRLNTGAARTLRRAILQKPTETKQ